MKEGILISFGELFLKSTGVQKIFKEKLEKNISLFLKKEKIDFQIFVFRERIFLFTQNFKKSLSILKNVFGISWFARSFFFEKENLKEVSNFIKENYQNWIGKNETFALRLKKGGDVKISRQEIIKELARKIKRKVDLENPDKEIFFEARKEGFYLYFKKEKGAKGLPVGSQGKVICLISGGIDSPVASYLIAKRGAENVWLHFHSFPLVSQTSIEKVKQLGKAFLKFQPKLKIYFFPFSQIQAEIKTKAWSKYLVLLYRRAMLKIAEKIAKKENCKAIVTGESLGQVSSQTLENLKIIENGIKIPILRPLIGMNKEEIIKISQKIGTFEISILPQEDCCTLFVSKHASGAGDLKKIKNFEKKIDFKQLIKNCWRKVEILRL